MSAVPTSMASPALASSALGSSALGSSALGSSALAGPALASPALAGPALASSALASPVLASPALASPALASLIADRRVWRGKPAALPPSAQPTGFAELDDALPTHGWPEASLTEILLPADGMGELQVLLPTLARLTQAGRRVLLIAPPYVPYAPAWHAAGVALAQLGIVDAAQRDMAWAMEQALRSGACGAVLGWLTRTDDRTLRRLEVAADTGAALGFVFRDRVALGNPSPAALRLEIGNGQLRVHKCRGGNPPAPVAFARTQA